DLGVDLLADDDLDLGADAPALIDVIAEPGAGVQRAVELIVVTAAGYGVLPDQIPQQARAGDGVGSPALADGEADVEVRSKLIEVGAVDVNRRGPGLNRALAHAAEADAEMSHAVFGEGYTRTGSDCRLRAGP